MVRAGRWQVLVLTEILTGSLNYGYATRLWSVLDTLNGEKVRDLRALHAAYQACDGEFLEFVFSHGGDKIVLDAAECHRVEADMLRMHAIPSIASSHVTDPHPT